MSIAIIQRLVIASCRHKIDVDIYRRIVPCLSIFRARTEFPVHDVSLTHKRYLHDSTICLEKLHLKENVNDITDNISTLQIKKRPSRRNRSLINDGFKNPKPNTWSVKALVTAEEYDLENLAYGLLDQQLYIPNKISTSTTRKYFYFS